MMKINSDIFKCLYQLSNFSQNIGEYLVGEGIVSESAIFCEPLSTFKSVKNGLVVYHYSNKFSIRLGRWNLDFSFVIDVGDSQLYATTWISAGNQLNEWWCDRQSVLYKSEITELGSADLINIINQHSELIRQYLKGKSEYGCLEDCPMEISEMVKEQYSHLGFSAGDIWAAVYRKFPNALGDVSGQSWLRSWPYDVKLPEMEFNSTVTLEKIPNLSLNWQLQASCKSDVWIIEAEFSKYCKHRLNDDLLGYSYTDMTTKEVVALAKVETKSFENFRSNISDICSLCLNDMSDKYPEVFTQ